mmetsp:Transcript_18062/g.63454  ORF Transcript_18062/g.63454 Transcript_18062/m.63454 type:complete len:208 (+) Transcript_18062:2378-3001(+)
MVAIISVMFVRAMAIWSTLQRYRCASTSTCPFRRPRVRNPGVGRGPRGGVATCNWKGGSFSGFTVKAAPRSCGRNVTSANSPPTSRDLAVAPRPGRVGGGEGKAGDWVPSNPPVPKPPLTPRALAGDKGASTPRPRFAFAPDECNRALEGGIGIGEKSCTPTASPCSRLNLTCGVSRLCFMHNQCSSNISGSRFGHRVCNSRRSCSR